MCGQEHKLRIVEVHNLQALWPSALFVIAPAKDDVHARRNQRVPAGRGGVFLAMGPHLSPFVTRTGILPSGRAVWALLDHPLLGRIGFLALYTPNGRHKRAQL